MKIYFLLICCLAICSTKAIAITAMKNSYSTSSTPSEIMSVSKTDLQKSLGRKLNWQERVGMKIMQFQMRHAKSTMPTSTSSTGCAKIALKNGSIVEVDIIQIAAESVKYKRCGKPTDPEIIESKDNIASIVAEDGAVLWRNDGNNSLVSNNEYRATYYAYVSLFLGALGWLFITLNLELAIAWGLVGFVVGIIALVKIKKDAKLFTLKKVAAWGVFSCALLSIIGLLLAFI